jgi:predicted 3-demethylubiquinone-9 3-methyltransferase (glyoxalase superfamily)
MSDDMAEVINMTKHADWRKRKEALSTICPCKVKKDIDVFWNRVFEMAREKDPAPQVRYQVLHTLCDGSPKVRLAIKHN